MRSVRFLLPALLALCSSNVAAQGPSVSIGDRVRVTAPVQFDGDVGQVMAVRDSGIVFRPQGVTDSVTIPWRSMERLQVSTGKHRPVVKRAGMGLIFGVLLGAAIGTLATEDYESGESLSEKSSSYAFAVGGIGAALGGAWAVIKPTDTWKDVDLDGSEAGLEASPRGDGFAFAVRLRF